MAKVLVLHGPNLNLLGIREPDIYGRTSLEDINAELKGMALNAGVEVECFQSNHEGELVTAIQRAMGQCQVIIINPAAYTHTSVALRDALAAVNIPTIEVHLSDPRSRESFRHISFLAGIVKGHIAGFGAASYKLALIAALDIIKKQGGK